MVTITKKYLIGGVSFNSIYIADFRHPLHGNLGNIKSPFPTSWNFKILFIHTSVYCTFVSPYLLRPLMDCDRAFWGTAEQLGN